MQRSPPENAVHKLHLAGERRVGIERDAGENNVAHHHSGDVGVDGGEHLHRLILGRIVVKAVLGEVSNDCVGAKEKAMSKGRKLCVAAGSFEYSTWTGQRRPIRPPSPALAQTYMQHCPITAYLSTVNCSHKTFS